MLQKKNRDLLIQRSRTLLKKIAKEESTYSRTLRDRVHGGAALIHWNYFRDGIVEEFGEEHWLSLVDVERTTDWAWRSGRQKPRMDHLFGINTIRLRRPLKDVAHPDVSGAVWYAVSSTMERIRKEDFGFPSAKLKQEEFRAVKAAVRHPLLFSLLKGQGTPQAQNQVLLDIADDARCGVSNCDAVRVSHVKKSMEMWFDAYCLFFGSLRPGWEGLLDETP